MADRFIREDKKEMRSLQDVYLGLLQSKLQEKMIPSQLRSWPLPTAASRVLDAPGVIDDYFLNTLDWSVRGEVAVGLHSSVYVWSATSGVRHLLDLSTSESDSNEYVSGVAWIHDGRQVGIGTSLGFAHVWDADRAKRIRSLPVSLGCRLPALSWNKHLLSAGSKDGTLQTHDVRIANSLVASVACGTSEVCGLRWSPDGRFLAAGSQDGSLRLCNERGVLSNTLSGAHKAAVKALAWNPLRPGMLATGGGSADHHIRLWDTSLSQTSSIDAVHQVSAMAWGKLADGHRGQNELVAAVSRAPAPVLNFYRCRRSLSGNTPDASPAFNLTTTGSVSEAHPRRILQAAVSPEGRTLCTLGGDETVRFWDCWGSGDADSPGSADDRCHADDDEGNNRNKKVVLLPPSMASRARNVRM